MTLSTHDSNTIRASILDVCLQLGALDSSNPIGSWMFGDSASSTSNQQNDEGKRHGSRFHESISPSLGLEGTAVLQVEKRCTPFSVMRFGSPSKSKSRASPGSHPESANDGRTARRETGFSSVRSFFRRASAQRSENHHYDGITDAHYHGGRTLSQPKPRSAVERINASSMHGNSSSMPRTPLSPTSPHGPSPLATPAARNLHDDGDHSFSGDDWEEIEVRPQSFLYALRHENGRLQRKLKKKQPRVSTEPSTRAESAEYTKPHRSLSSSFAFPRPHTPKHRKSSPRPVPVLPPSGSQSHHHASLSTLALSSSFAPATPPDTACATPLVNASFESAYKPQFAHRPSMGYHNQFFVRDTSQPIASKLAPSLPPSSPLSRRERRVSFPQLRARHPTPL